MRVYGNGSGTNYGLTLNLDQAGNNRSNARSLGDLTGDRKEYKDFIGTNSGDPYDYYKFSTNKPCFLDYALRDLTANADVDILDSRGNRIKPTKVNQDSGYNQHESIVIGTGTYYARVKAPTNSSRQTNYRLVLNLRSDIPRENTNGTEWNGSFYRFDGSRPPVNFHENEGNKLAVLNLGRGDNKRFSGNWGSASPRTEYIPRDNFALRSYTHASFEQGKEYEFNVNADDGYQLLAKRHHTNEWFYITPKNQWKNDAHDGKTISYTWDGRSGDYDLHFHYYEAGGDARFNLDWNEVNGSWQQPISNYYVTSEFGPRILDGKYNFHRGIDLGSPTRVGTPILAAKPGVVSFAGWNNSQNQRFGLGKYVQIDHGNGLVTQYGHLNSWSVNTGDRVSGGTQIGTMGNTGYSFGPHLHFVIKENGVHKNPRDYLDF